MMKLQVSLGKVLFISAIGLLPLSVFVLYKLPPEQNISLYSVILPWTSLTAAIILNVLIQLQYPRVKNGRVLLLGVTAALISVLLLMHYVFSLAVIELSSAFIIGTAGIFLCVLAPGVSGGLKIRVVLIIYMVLIVTVITVLMLYQKSFIQWVLAEVPVIVRAFVVFLFAGIISMLTRFKVRSDFGFEGIIAATGILYCFGIYISLSRSSEFFVSLLSALLSLYLVTGTIFHWFLRLNHRAHYDPLLKIYNRGYADSILEQNPQTSPYSVVLFDIDHFKSVNDSYGHQAGDTVLFEVAQTIQQRVVPEAIVCRYGGEEIIGFFPGKDVNQTVDIAEECRKNVEALSIPVGKRTIRVTVSGGVAERQAGDVSLVEVIASADACLYKAKENGRNLIIGTKQKTPASGRRKRIIQDRNETEKANTKEKPVVKNDAVKKNVSKPENTKRKKTKRPVSANKPLKKISKKPAAKSGRKPAKKKTASSKKKGQKRTQKQSLIGKDWSGRS